MINHKVPSINLTPMIFWINSSYVNVVPLIYKAMIVNILTINWHEGYFPEEDIQRFYAESDYVFLPYTPSFTASSGVLAYATSFKKPIISTNHGLIGYKVKHYGLGYTYKYNSIHQLSKIFSTLPTRHTQTYKEKSNNALLHQEKHSIEEHQKILIKALTND